MISAFFVLLAADMGLTRESADFRVLFSQFSETLFF